MRHQRHQNRSVEEEESVYELSEARQCTYWMLDAQDFWIHTLFIGNYM